MIVIPAIDLRDGRCVRLLQGDFNVESVYADDPVEVAQRWERAGAPMIHVVDLDGARKGSPQQGAVIQSIVGSVDLPVQVGGGVRAVEHIASLVECGVERVILGTAAVENPDVVTDALAAYGPERVLIGVDARAGYVATNAWLDTTDVRGVDLVARMRDLGARWIIYTDIERDGTMSSPNFEATAEVAALGVNVVASGGVSDIEHLRRLAAIPNVEAAIVGRALYTGDIQLVDGEWSVMP